MANQILTSLTALTTPASDDSLYIVDASDVSENPAGTSKKISYSNLTSTFVTNPVNLTSQVTGTLPVANGGTGLATLTSGSVLTGNGTGAVTLVATTGSSNFVRATSPTLVTPVLGAATATSINGLTITSSTGTLTITNGKTLSISNTITLAGTDGQTYTFPSSTATIAGIASTQTLSNKRVTRRTVSVTQAAEPTINTDNTDVAYITGLAQAITSFTTNLSGTPNANDLLWISITDNGTARALTFGSSFEASGNVALPTTTVISTRLDILFCYNIATSKWRCLAVS